jgi:hypothetical protein
VHFGLGDSPTARELEVRWPSGTRQLLRNIKVDRILTLQEPAA